MKQYTTCGAVAALLRDLQKEGWRFERRKKHSVAFHSSGARFSFSVSPSDSQHVVKNIRADAIRQLRNAQGKFPQGN